jgi:hypothetical protein
MGEGRNVERKRDILGKGEPRTKNNLPESGSVLGVDVGCSAARPSSAACRFDWTATEIIWTFSPRFVAKEPNRTMALRGLADRALIVAAFDGPLRGDFAEIGRYRSAEQLLTRGLGRFIGKPGQSSACVGRDLNKHANFCAEIILADEHLMPAIHTHQIHAKAIVEAFPSTFLGLLLEKPLKKSRRNKRSDDFYVHLAETGELNRLLMWLLPGRHISNRFGEVKDHDDRAALVCALSALCVAAGDYTAVGDIDGWIILPPRRLIPDWAWPYLENNAKERSGLAWCEPVPITPTRSQPAAARTLPHPGGGKSGKTGNVP